MHREISRTSSYIRSGVICAFKRLHHTAMVPKSLISLLYCYGFSGISKDTYIIKAECMKRTFWYQNQEMNIQRGARGDNQVLSALHPKKLVYFLHFLFYPVAELVLQLGFKRIVRTWLRMLLNPWLPWSPLFPRFSSQESWSLHQTINKNRSDIFSSGLS